MKLKPFLDSIKIRSLEQIIRDIEMAGKENKSTENLTEQINFLETRIKEVAEEMQKELV